MLCAAGATHGQERWFERTLETGDGAVELVHVTGGRMAASRVSGDVVLKRAEQVELDAIGGNVTVTDRATPISVDGVIVDLGTLVD